MCIVLVSITLINLPYVINGGMLGCFVWQVAMSVTPACKCDLLIKKGN